MTPLTPSYRPHANRRAPRFRLVETTPAVLQFANSRPTTGELQSVSRTGGLLALAKPVDQGLVGELMFRTHRGLVFATAEMLRPLSWNCQPFRFVEVKEDDRRKLQAAFQTGLYRNMEEEEWIEEFRAAILNAIPPPRRKHFFGAVPTAVTLAILGLGSVIYALSAHLR